LPRCTPGTGPPAAKQAIQQIIGPGDPVAPRGSRGPPRALHSTVTTERHGAPPFRGRPTILGRADNWQSTAIYGFAHLGKSLFWYTSELLFAYFLTEFVGLSVGDMGIVIASGLLVSAAIDVGVGLGLNRQLRDQVSAGKWQLIGAALCSAALMLVFLGAWLPVEWRFAYAVAAGIAFRLGFASYDIPQNALMALATADAESRLRIASTRIWFSGAATLVVATTIGPLVARREQPAGILLLLGLGILFAVVAVISAWLLARVLVGRAHQPAPAHPPAPRGRRAADFWLLLAVMVATSLFTPAFSKLEPYFATYTLRSAWWGGVVIILMSVGIVAGQPLWLLACRRMRRGTVMIFAALVQLAALTGFWFTGGERPAMAAAAAFAFGLGNGGVGMVQWATFSEVVARLGADRAGPSYGLFAATAKVSLAGGGLLLAASLDRIDFRGAQGWALALPMAAIPAAGAVCCILIGIALYRFERRAPPAAPSG
jgi:Na+/melibiose symporter-like transporter